MNIKSLYLFFFLGIVFISQPIFSQKGNPVLEEPTDDLGNVSDAFQENFFEALKQKAIENYELALNALKRAEKASKKNPENLAIVYFERGKNQRKLKQFEDAENSFKEALKIKNEQLDVKDALYDVYHIQRKYQDALPLVLELVKTDPDYKEDLANLYFKTKQYQESLDLIDELDALWGENFERNLLKKQVYKATGNSSKEIDYLVNKINSKPKKEKEYIHLIYLYSEKGQPKKAFETAQELLQKFPKSQLAHLALYKFYLEEGATKKAINSMEMVFKSTQIKTESKYAVLGDFITFVNKNPSFEKDLEKTISYFSKDTNGKVYEKLGDYYQQTNQLEKALYFYKNGLENDKDNYSLFKNTILLQIKLSKHEDAVALSNQALEIFPSQALLYLLNAVGNNHLNKPEEAIESLELGIDFLLENPTMEKDFYVQFQKAYTTKGNSKKATIYQNKINALDSPKN